jgi:predicted ATPase/class 3 adenylate cyclase/predicted negative regulator of RcsB-dependent stress response
MSEVRALLLTDVVDSTQLAESLGDAAVATLWMAHDRLARDLLPSWRGREIDKTDGMLLLFDCAADAVGYALAYQRSLASLDPPLRARAGLHVGPVMLRENSKRDVALGAKPLEVEGAAKATAARVMSVANGGQILLSATAREALGDAGTLRLLSHGHWRLKGLVDPMELFEVGDDCTPFTPPLDAAKAYRVIKRGDLWLPARSIRHSLPAERDSFVGRDQALLEVARRLATGARLVSVLGLGGTGKTRLATRFGWAWLGDFPGGVWFCDLSQARSLDGLVHAVAQGLEVPLGKDDPVTQLGHAIAGRGACLVILDNFEQVTRHAQDSLGHWLNRAADARFLVTTREVLGLPGENVFALSPLPPAESADLFMQRAEAAKAGFLPNAEDRAAIAPLVKLLEGLPLAIELAAARVRVMPPRTLLLRMSERFKLLASSGGRVDRQATLRAVFDWSWELLSLPEKAALAQLSVFEGGFTLEAAEEVLDLSAFENAPWLLDALQSLVQKSFVRQVEDDRFDLLVSVKEYAAEHLQTEGRYAGSGPHAKKAAQVRHVEWFAALGPERSIEGNCADLDNLVTACRRAVTFGDGDLAAGALEGAWAALSLRGPFEAGVRLAESVCAMPGLSDRASARALSELADASVACGRLEPASALYDRALASARAAGDRCCETQVRLRLGSMLENKGQFEQARAHYAETVRMAQELGDRQLECSAIMGLGNLDLTEGRTDVALLHYKRALALARERDDRRMQGKLLGNLGNVYMDIGRLEEARVHYEEALAIARETGHRKLEGNTLCNLGMLQITLGCLDEAEGALKAALILARELGDVRLEGIVLCNLGIVLERMDRHDEALARFEAAVRIARSLGDPRYEGQFLGYLGLLEARQGRHVEAQRSLDSGEALLRAASDLFGLGVLMSGRAEAHYLAGDGAAATASLSAAAALAAQVGAGPASEISLALARVTALIEAA